LKLDLGGGGGGGWGDGGKKGGGEIDNVGVVGVVERGEEVDLCPDLEALKW